MKFITVIAALFAGLLAGCSTTNQKNAGAFVKTIAGMDITAADISQSTSTPLYSHQESITGLHHDANHLEIENLKASFSIPLWGTKWDFSASSIQAAKPEQLAPIAKVIEGKGAPVK